MTEPDADTGPALQARAGGGPGSGPRHPVEIQVAAGLWQLDAVTDGTGEVMFTADLLIGAAGASPRRVWSAAQPEMWMLEEELGWAIPHPAQNVLLNHATAGPPPGAVVGPDRLADDAVRGAAFRPTRASVVGGAEIAAARYGRLLHVEPRVRRWRNGSVQMDLYRAEVDGRLTAAYRISEITAGPSPTETVVFSGLLIGFPDVAALTSDATIRYVLLAVLRRGMREDGFSDRQLAFVLDHSERIAEAAADLLEHPYPRGTRVVVHDDDPTRTATGTILGVADTSAGPAYLWRPDVAELPGHPWYSHPTRALRTPAHRVTPTLNGPDTNSGRDSPMLLATGAIVAPIEDLRFTVATVLRAFDDDTHIVSYEIQPHDGALPPQRLPAGDVTPLRGTAWPTVDALLAARALAELPPQPGEILATSHEVAVVLDAPSGVHVSFPKPTRQPPRPDPTVTDTPSSLVPDAGRRPVDPAISTGATAPSQGPRHAGGTVHIDDPIHGHLEVPATAFHTAMRQPPGILTALLTRCPWLPPPTPDQPLHLTAALTVLHTPLHLAALTATPAAPTAPESAAVPTSLDPVATPNSQARLQALPHPASAPATDSPTTDPGL
ncbi:hypothetical protein [Pseudofrankia sp. DC12]|uniref:hypothetical protein n=1 Tax=Pseudofrankia sp. DC12 TaxID=683315 RepID=UPI0005F81A6B|nr:hypothetical protein [Pseudofrankia sp. DC12]